MTDGGIELLVDRTDPLDCGQGCYPPHRPFMVRASLDSDELIPTRHNQTTHRVGDRWICQHGTAYVAFDPSGYGHYCAYRKWRKLGPFGSWLARRQARKETQ